MSESSLLIEIIGWTGSALCLAAYLLTSMGRLSGKSALYQAMNFLGGATLAINVIWHGAYPAALLEIGWALIGLVALIGIVRVRIAAPSR
ncbi:MAG: hypothetical protein BVN33_16515 [Proteobacteria bacterium ST_bin13]|nr:MAG: hypothetical protein BVN33_16515 [Proteobacteria bacterium ST_bin13]